MSAAPTTDELAAYLRGALPRERFAAVERWLEGIGEDRAADALAAAEALLPALVVALPTPPEGFTADPAHARLRLGAALGEGGMATVHRAADRALEREVALKVLRPRRADEDLERYHLRAQAFRREAAITAGLDHPAIPRVHDIGTCDGRPAFTMQLLAGRPLDERVRAGDLPLAGLTELLLRAVEAVAYAHSRGLVHRDLTPANVLVADFGAVYVLDWGLAAQTGAGGGARAGTPAWMAPEQATGAPADPRMDVFALGGLLHLVLTGRGPRPDPSRPGHLDLAGLDARGVPRGLAAVARRCLADPAARYADAGAVLAELRRWLDEGITVAQEAGPLERAWLRLRRSPQARVAAVAGLILGLAAGTAWTLHLREQRRDARARVQRIAAAVDLQRPEAIRVARSEVMPILQAHPGLGEARQLADRLQAAADVLAQQEEAAARERALDDLLAHARRTGPWPGEIAAWSAALAGVGIDIAAAAPAWAGHRRAAGIAEALAWLWRAAAERGESGQAAQAAGLLAAGGPTPGWRALGRACAAAAFRAHDPVAPEGADIAAALADPDSATVVLAVFAPAPALDARAIEILRERPGDFRALIASARAALARGDLVAARRDALVASGADPDSMFPPLYLAYEALARGDDAELARAVGRGLRANPDHTELLALQAVALARAGHREDAQAVVEGIGGAHLQYHLQHRVGHAMERSVDALVAAGLRIPEAAPDLGPVAPEQDPHRHHRH